MGKLVDPASKAKADFVYIESNVGLTFAELALETRDKEKRARVTHYARRAYDTALRSKKLVQLDPLREANLNRNLLRLKDQLQLLGEIF